MSLRKTWPFATIGVVLSCYALYVEHKVAHKPPEEEFTALCDIEQLGASCSSVFQLPEGRMLSYFGIVPHDHVLDVPNAALGLIYYSIWLLVMPSLPKKLTLLVSSLAMTSSVFLAIQLLILKELCLLCWSTHVINSRLFFSAVATALFSSSSTKKDDGKAKVKRV